MAKNLLPGILLEIALLPARPAAAAWPTDPLVNVPVCTAGNHQYGQSLVRDGAGGCIVSWLDFRNGVGSDIYAQHVLASGVVDPAWPPDGRALCTAANDQMYPKCVADGAGGAIVAWYDYRSGVDFDIYVQHVLASGVVDPAWPAGGRALCTAVGAQYTGGIVSDGNGGAIVAWEDARTGTTFETWDVYAQHVVASGVVDPAWPDDGRAVCTAVNAQEGPATVADGTGGAIVIWRDYRASDTHDDIYAQHVLSSGTIDPAWPTDGRAVCTFAGDQFPAGAVGDGAGGAIVAWADARSGGYPETNYDVYAQHVLLSGAVDPAWPGDGRALCTAAGAQFSSGIIGDGAGGAIVTWEDRRGGGVADIFAQRVLGSGAIDPIWPTDGRALCTATNDQYSAAIVEDGVGGAIVTWEDYRGANSDIYAQHVLGSGAVDPAWPGDGRMLCGATGDQRRPEIIADAAGGAIAAWYDNRNVTFDVYAQRVGANGELGSTVDASGESAVGFALGPVRPNPARGRALVVSFTLPSGAAASLELLDVSGRRVAGREVGSLGAGRHAVDLRVSRGLAPGIYWLRLRQGTSARSARVAVVD